MMEKLDSSCSPSTLPSDLPCPISSSSTSSPTCTSVERGSPSQNESLTFTDAISSPCPETTKTGCAGHEDTSTSGAIQSPKYHTDKAAGSITIEPKREQVEKNEEEEEARRSPTAHAASNNKTPELSSPPPLLPASAKTPPHPLSPHTYASSIMTSSSLLPSHIPVISLGDSKPHLPLPNTPLTALHPIPSILHGPHGDIHCSQETRFTAAGPTAPSQGSLLAQQYLSTHPFFIR